MSDGNSWEQKKIEFKRLGIESVELNDLETPEDILGLIPSEIANVYRMVPISVDANRIVFATADPTNNTAINNVSRLLESEITVVLAEREAVTKAVDKYYPISSTFMKRAKLLRREQREL